MAIKPFIALAQLDKCSSSSFSGGLIALSPGGCTSQPACAAGVIADGALISLSGQCPQDMVLMCCAVLTGSLLLPNSWWSMDPGIVRIWL